MISEERRQGLIDGLEMALDAVNRSDSLFDVKDLLLYYIKINKEEKIENLKEQLGAFR